MLTLIIPDVPFDVFAIQRSIYSFNYRLFRFYFTYSDHAQLSLMKHRSIISILIFAEHKESIEWIVFDNAFD